MLLSVSDVTVQFGGVTAVANLSLEVDRGELIGIIGPNGAGKTTVFNCLTGFYKPTVGRLAVNRDGHEHLLEQMQGFAGGLNDGVWFLTLQGAQPMIFLRYGKKLCPQLILGYRKGLNVTVLHRTYTHRARSRLCRRLR